MRWSRQPGRSARPRPWRLVGEAPLLLGLSAGVLLAALVLGGSSAHGLRSDAVVQLAGLVLLAVALPRLLSQSPLPPLARSGLSIAGAILALPLVQLIPLPPGWWTSLPGRGLLEDGLGAAGLALPWWPVSLDPTVTWQSLLSLIAPVALFAATLSLDARGRRALCLFALAAGLVALFLGLVQVLQGPGSALRFYDITNPASSVGFFANRNHQAALLYALIPFAAAWAVGRGGAPGRLSLPLVWCGATLVILLVGATLTFSRAGILLAIAALALSLTMVARAGSFNRTAFWTVIAAGAAAILLIIQNALSGVIGQFATDPLDEQRLDILALSWNAARAYLPIGAGFGTFSDVYSIHEPIAALQRDYVNHAHNDWLQITLEGGLPAVFLLAMALLWVGYASWRAWRAPLREGMDLDRALRQAASIAILLLLLHSLVDYPLRTTALMTLLAMCLAMLVPPLDDDRVTNADHGLARDHLAPDQHLAGT